MGRWVVFSEVVCFVEATGCPVEVKLFLGNAVFEPMIPHVEGFGTFHADLGFENVMCGGVVGLERRAGGGLGMPHFLECSDDGDGFLSSDEEAAGFGF